ncbi:hypothetical protein [Nonomuraea recticatena]|uniref:WD40 repeat domain-containing protein n=1 Tax=Nonomuraea recticatena TaxID=46178 RepID=A0ABP6FBU6_9ACTN
MEIKAVPAGRAHLRNAARVVGPPWAVEVGRAGPPRMLLGEGTSLELHDLDAFFGAEPSLISAFAVPWPDEESWEAAVSPDGDVGVFCNDEAVRAVTPTGAVLWEHRGHRRHSRKENRSSCRVSDDGRHVWAMLPGPPSSGVWRDDGTFDGTPYQGDEWLVLAADTGRVVARETLDCAAVGGEHLPHADGRHMGLGVGEGQDGLHVYWGRLEEDGLRVWKHEDDYRILLDVHPSGLSYLSYAPPDEIAWHSFPGGLIMRRLEAADAWRPATGEAYWDGADYVDADTVIATATLYAETPQDARHILIDAVSGQVRGEVRYPTPAHESAYPLGDGTWLTAEGDTLFRWTYR